MYVSYLDGLCSCSWSVPPGWRWFGSRSFQRWPSTAPRLGVWTGTEEPGTSAPGTDHLKQTHTVEEDRVKQVGSLTSGEINTWIRKVQLSLSDCCSQSKQLNALVLTTFSIMTAVVCLCNSYGPCLTAFETPAAPRQTTEFHHPQKRPQVCLLCRSDILPPSLYHTTVQGCHLHKHLTESQRRWEKQLATHPASLHSRLQTFKQNAET